MSQLSGLGMTDVASRPRGGRVWWLGLGTFMVILMYVGLRNYLFVQDGMLNPNFELIHKAYDFNFGELPLILIGVGVFFFGLALTWRGYRKWLLIFAGLYWFFGLDVLALRYYVTQYEPSQLVVHRVTIKTPKLTTPLRLLHISDIQSGAISEHERKIFDEIKALEPDIIINTGDFLQVVPPATFESELPKLMALIREVNPRYGTYAAFGDTELEMYRVPPDELKPMEFLASQSQQVLTDAGVLSLHGLNLNDSRRLKWTLRSVSPWLETSEVSDFRILFGHAPDFALEVADLPIDLCLAGHTHGGQVRLPGYGPLVIDSQIPKEWARGFRQIGVPYLNVSAGAGSNRRGGLPPLRFNCPTEMTVIDLVPLRTIR